MPVAKHPAITVTGDEPWLDALVRAALRVDPGPLNLGGVVVPGVVRQLLQSYVWPFGPVHDKLFAAEGEEL